MLSKATDFTSVEAHRAELESVLQSELFARAPTLAHLLSYLCEKTFAGESEQIKEYSIGVDVLGRSASFDQDADSIVRVQANRLRKRLAEYYEGPGKAHRIHISVPIGQYVPIFHEQPAEEVVATAENPPVTATEPSQPSVQVSESRRGALSSSRRLVIYGSALALILLAAALIYFTRGTRTSPSVSPTAEGRQPSSPEVPTGLPVGDEVRILAGGSRDYVDHAGKAWTADRYFAGGTPVRSAAPHIWRTQDAEIYRNSRQGEFKYDIPLKPGRYELRLHFAETFYGPEDQGGGGEGSRVMLVRANDRVLLSDFDVVADAAASRTADVKVFTDIAPAEDGLLHLHFSSVHGGRGMISGIEVLPGARGRMRPLRILTREAPYYSNDSHWWSPDTYFKGGQLAVRQSSGAAGEDPELYESERWGNFSYAIPVTPGRYTVILHFIEHRFGPGNRDRYMGPPHDANVGAGGRVFTVFCNGKTIARELDIFREAGENRPLIRKITGLEANPQGKLLLEFVPLKDYATVTALEVLPE
jgi:hypothetical protein